MAKRASASRTSKSAHLSMACVLERAVNMSMRNLEWGVLSLRNPGAMGSWSDSTWLWLPPMKEC